MNLEWHHFIGAWENSHTNHSLFCGLDEEFWLRMEVFLKGGKKGDQRKLIILFTEVYLVCTFHCIQMHVSVNKQKKIYMVVE